MYFYCHLCDTKMSNVLCLASKSLSRQKLLNEAKIPFIIIDQNADEAKCDWSLPLPQVVASIARYKMEHAIMPSAKESDYAFVLTADTLSQDNDGTIQGKPIDRSDAIEKIKKARDGSCLYTAFCLDRRIFINGSWELDQRIERCVGAEYLFVIPDQWIETYLDNSIGLSASNAIVIDEFGAQFAKMVRGSYTSIVGLPMYELREALEELGFF